MKAACLAFLVKTACGLSSTPEGKAKLEAAEKQDPEGFRRNFEAGLKVEQEHGADKAEITTKDHMVENPGYYDAFAKVKGALEGEKTAATGSKSPVTYVHAEDFLRYAEPDFIMQQAIDRAKAAGEDTYSPKLHERLRDEYTRLWQPYPVKKTAANMPDWPNIDDSSKAWATVHALSAKIAASLADAKTEVTRKPSPYPPQRGQEKTEPYRNPNTGKPVFNTMQALRKQMAPA